ncbi:MAG TPA: hypothetical protein VG815_22365 [Chloroflexota bacterium]|jgi:hypothetical protein|nr:hypothetical protein [Chloroflexota bacterium]
MASGSTDDNPQDILSPIIIREAEAAAGAGRNDGSFYVPETVALMFLEADYVDSIGGWFIDREIYYSYEMTREPDGYRLDWDRRPSEAPTGS